MIRYFLVMAVTGGSLLVADFVLGFFATGAEHGPGAIARGVHVLFSLATVLWLLAVHSIVYTYFVATGKWAKEVVRVYQLPDWINIQAKKNKRRAFRFIMWSMTLLAVAAWLGAAADTRGSAYSLWHLGGAACALAFNLGSFVVEYTVIVAQVRLLAEVKDRADRLRESAVHCAKPRCKRWESARSVRRKRLPDPPRVMPWPKSCTKHQELVTNNESLMQMTPLAVIVLIVLVDLLGFSLVMPLLGPFAEHYGFRDWQIGLLFSAYPICQLIAGPILGRTL